MMNTPVCCCIVLFVSFACGTSAYFLTAKVDYTKCPVVKAMRNFDLKQILGQWYVVEYYASSEEELSYKCMRTEFTDSDKVLSNGKPSMEITMNFTYAFINDPQSEVLVGNITWDVPDTITPAHWVHAEDTYEGIYNTYVLDTDYITWTLLMHCAEKEKSTRYLSAFIMSRDVTLPHNVISYLRDKLPRYGIDVNFMFDMIQDNCDTSNPDILSNIVTPSVLVNGTEIPRRRLHRRRHPLRRHHKNMSKETSSKEKILL